MSRPRILVLHPDPAARALLGSMLRSPELEVVEAAVDRPAVRMLATLPAVVLIGVGPDEPDALDLLYSVTRKLPGTPVILLASHPARFRDTIPMGAAAVLKFPPTADLLRSVVAEALRAVRPGSRVGDVVTASDSVFLRPLKEAMEEHEREVIVQALRALGWSRQATARALEIDRTTLYAKMRKYRLFDGWGD